MLRQLHTVFLLGTWAFCHGLQKHTYEAPWLQQRPLSMRVVLEERLDTCGKVEWNYLSMCTAEARTPRMAAACSTSAELRGTWYGEESMSIGIANAIMPQSRREGTLRVEGATGRLPNPAPGAWQCAL